MFGIGFAGIEPLDWTVCLRLGWRELIVFSIDTWQCLALERKGGPQNIYSFQKKTFPIKICNDNLGISYSKVLFSILSNASVLITIFPDDARCNVTAPGLSLCLPGDGDI